MARPFDLFMPESADSIKREREKARLLKKTRWWREKLKKGVCRLCGKTFAPEALTMDHLVPLVRGGRTGKNNVDTACKKCNSEKAFKSLLELKR